MPPVRVHRTTVAAAAAALIAALPVAAAGGSSTPRCQTADLAARLVPGNPAAGQRYATLRLTNVGAGACHLRGYPGAQLLRAGVRLPTDIVRNPGAVKRVRLARGDRAVSLWHWTVVPDRLEPTAAACEPTAKRIRITPPNASKALKIRWRLGTVCGHGRIDVDPVRAE